jgi:hypothetical protein
VRWRKRLSGGVQASYRAPQPLQLASLRVPNGWPYMGHNGGVATRTRSLRADQSSPSACQGQALSVGLHECMIVWQAALFGSHRHDNPIVMRIAAIATHIHAHAYACKHTSTQFTLHHFKARCPTIARAFSPSSLSLKPPPLPPPSIHLMPLFCTKLRSGGGLPPTRDGRAGSYQPHGAQQGLAPGHTQRDCVAGRLQSARKQITQIRVL